MSNIPSGISGKFILAAINWDGEPDLDGDFFTPETFSAPMSIDDLTENLDDIFEEVISQESIPAYVGIYKLVEVAEVKSGVTFNSVYNEANSKTTPKVESKPDQLVTAQAEDQSPLTPREKEVLNLSTAGLDVYEIARRTNIAPKTVLNYLYRIRKKQQQASIDRNLSVLTPRERQLYDWLRSGKSVESFAHTAQIGLP